MKIFLWLCAGFCAWVILFTFALSSALTGTQPAGASQGAFAQGADLGLDAEQRRNAEISLRVSDELNSPPLAVLAMITAALGESNLKVVPNAQGSGYCGVYQADPDNIPCDDTEEQARSFQKGGKGFQGGGAIALANNQSSLSPGTIATMVEASGQPGSWYDVNDNGGAARAAKIIAAWRAGGTVSEVADTDPDVQNLVREADRMISLHRPYTWGGGHIRFDPDGPWDCSGSLSWLFHHLGLLNGAPLASWDMAKLGRAGRGQIFTIYANNEHVFIVVETGSHSGDSFGTATRDLEGAQGSGPMWHRHPTKNFVARHFEGW